MGFWEKMTGKRTEPLPAETEAPESEAENPSPSPELAAEAEETKEHLAALEKIVDDPELETRIAGLAPERRESLWERYKRLGALVVGVTAPMGTADLAIKAAKFAAAGQHETAMSGAGLAIAGLGISIVSLRYVYRRFKERLKDGAGT